MRLGLKQIVKKHLLLGLIQELVRATQSSHSKIIVIDEQTLPIFSRACGMLDLVDEDVTLIEKLELGRKPFMYLDAIYFISPTMESIQRLLNDLSAPVGSLPDATIVPKYHAAHVFFSSTVPDELMDMISASSGASHIKSLVELQLEFLTIETNIFSVALPDTFYEMFSPNATKLPTMLPVIARRISTLCASISELNPIIRYRQATSERTRCTSQLAALIADELQMLRETSDNNTKKSNVAFNNSPATILLLDRTMDMSTPFLHELTYQAMATDIIPLTNGNGYSYESTNLQGVKVRKDALLDETRDELWARLRHAHMATVVESVNSEFLRFRQQNSAAAREISPNVKLSNKELADYLRAMPEYQDQVSKYSLHVSLATQCMRRYQELKLADIIAVEQNVACGYTQAGDRVKNAPKEIMSIFSLPLSSIDKLRILLLCLLSSSEMTESDRDKLLDAAKLNMDELRTTDNATFLQAAMMIASEQQVKLQKRKYQLLEQHQDSSSIYSQELSRYLPTLRVLMEDAVTGLLSVDEYPYLDSSAVVRDLNDVTVNPVYNSGASKPSTSVGNEKGGNNGFSANSRQNNMNPLSARTTKAAWQTAGETGDNAPTSSKKNGKKKPVEFLDDEALQGPPLIVFVLGGITYSEARVAYELMRVHGREVYLGSTAIWTPSEFVKQVALLTQAF